jgi:ubiquinone/menaquinone biosynthesis C-methylase UbiE
MQTHSRSITMSNLAVPQETTQGRRTVLHVGCGPAGPDKLPLVFRTPEWQEVRLDIDPEVTPDIVASITDMPAVPEASMNAVYSSHNLEHLYAHEVPLALREFWRVLRPGGLLFIQVPDLQAVAAEVAKGNLENALYISPAGPIAALDILYGLRAAISRGNYFMAHRTGFTARTLSIHILASGFRQVQVTHDSFELVANAHR